MSRFDCEFVDKPPKYLQTDCPVCLLILCEPYQVTCCGKSFCKECIGKIKARSQPCPTCKQDKFEFFSNKGLQQPLYGFAVFCSNKERGCVWEGELGQLDQHINSNPDKEKQLVGCTYANIACLFCDNLYPRHKMEQHQTSLCPKRPFTCFMCEEYEASYEDVVNSHAPVCKCRPVECPNSCGADNLQHQHLEEHVSSQCPLTYVECEFSDAGCDAKMYRKDLASHLTDNLVTHMSLLAVENRKLKQQLQKQEEKATGEITRLGQELQKQKELIERQEKGKQDEKLACFKLKLEFLADATRQGPLLHFPPFDLPCPINFVTEQRSWASEPIYIARDNIYRIPFRLVVTFIPYNVAVDRGEIKIKKLCVRDQRCEVTVLLVDQHRNSRNHRTFQLDVGESCDVGAIDYGSYVKDDKLIFCVADIKKYGYCY